MPFGLDLLKATGSQAAGGIVSEGLGLLTQGLKNRQQFKQAKKLQGLQIEGSKEMTDYNMAKQLQMWKDTSYGAQVEQMNKAGINPALMYGMGGGGGQTAGNASGNVSGQSAGTAQKSSGGEGMGLMIAQMGLMDAQKKNIEADTYLKQVNAKKTEEVDTDLAYANINKIKQDIRNSKAQERIMWWEEGIKKAEWNVESQSIGARMATLQSISEQAASAAEMIERENNISEQTKQSKIDGIRATTAGIFIENELKAAGINKTNAECIKIAADIMQNWYKLSLEERKTIIVEKVGHFNSSQSQRTYDNILKGIQTVTSAIKPGTVINQGPKETTIINN